MTFAPKIVILQVMNNICMGEVCHTNAYMAPNIHCCVHKRMQPHDLPLSVQHIYIHLHTLSSAPVVQQQSSVQQCNVTSTYWILFWQLHSSPELQHVSMGPCDSYPVANTYMELSNDWLMLESLPSNRWVHHIREEIISTNSLVTTSCQFYECSARKQFSGSWYEWSLSKHQQIYYYYYPLYLLN